MDTLTIIVEFLIVLAALFYGSKYGNIALGAISGIGLAVLVFGFGLKPGTPPTDVIYIIIAAVTCAAFLQASGGMNWMIQLAEKLLRRHPDHITFLAPLCTFVVTIMVGTGHVVYTLMPIICDISLKKGIRPERPCAVSCIASQVGITCSPIAAAVVAFTSISCASGFEVTIPEVLSITIPSCLCGLIVASLLSYHRGKDLDKDPEFLAKIADPEQKKAVYGNSATTLDTAVSREAKLSVWIFLAAMLVIVMFAIFPDILPSYDGKKLGMNLVIQIVMLTAAAMMVIFCKALPTKASDGVVWKSGMVAVVAIYGIAWLADTFVANQLGIIKSALGGIVEAYPWTIAFAFFFASVLISSQGAVVVALLPLAYSLGIPGPVLLGVLPSVYGYFFIPNYPSVIATVNMDSSGTTRIGKWLLNHSFMMPGLVSVSVSTVVGSILTYLFY